MILSLLICFSIVAYITVTNSDILPFLFDNVSLHPHALRRRSYERVSRGRCETDPGGCPRL